MGSLENGVSLKRDPVIRTPSSASPSTAGRADKQQQQHHPFLPRTRSRFSRFFLFQKLDYLQWICTVAVFLLFVVFFQMFLPGSVIEDESSSEFKDVKRNLGNLNILRELGILEFGEDIRFEPSKFMQKFQKEGRGGVNFSSPFNKTRHRFGYIKPQLALVFADLMVDSQQLLMVTVGAALQELGYRIGVYSVEDGPVHNVWREMGVPVNLIQACDGKSGVNVDWLNYDGILLNSLEVKGIFSCFLQEPFKSLPLIWTIHDTALAARLLHWQIDLLNDWKRAFNRSTVVVFPNYIHPMVYSTFDTGNFFVIPGSPTEAWEVNIERNSDRDSLLVSMGFTKEDTVIAIVGSLFLYRGMWLEHSIILQAILPVLQYFPFDDDGFNSHLKIIVLSPGLGSNYSIALEAIAQKLGYPRGVVNYAADTDSNSLLRVADLLIYGSFLEEQSFPGILIKAMCLEKPIIAPDLSIIKKYVDDRVNGYIFPKQNVKALTQILAEVILRGKLSPLARNIASIGKATAKNLLVSDAIEGYALLLDKVLKLPSEVALAKAVLEIPPKFKEKWVWHLFENFSNLPSMNRTSRSLTFLDKFEKQWNLNQKERLGALVSADDSFVYSIWEEEKHTATSNSLKRKEEELIKDRTDQPHSTWDDIYRSSKKADRGRNDLHERDEGELERTGQPLCIYEPYYGEGIWPFLHNSSLYRGIGLSTKGRRAGADDVDAPSRLQLLSNPYYRDILGEYGAFFSLSNRIDRIHKNAWIGFQSWRASARKVSLSKIAENALVHAIQTQKHGDALYFWVRMDRDHRNPLKVDFWSFCDAINAGNCKFAFSEVLKMMYGVKDDLDSLPPMPVNGEDTWSVMQSWALPTKSFLEFVMFSRMFVDALDSQMYPDHHSTGHCILSFSKDKHCYSRLLELLVNVWAYHSARQIVYVDPRTGGMEEQHKFIYRRGQMWIHWFSYSTIKSMDEDFAEEIDSEHPTRRWLWPLTGEIFWKGIHEREKSLRFRQRETKKQKSKEKLDRMRHRRRQKVIGKYVRPRPETNLSNGTVITESIMSESN